MHHLGNLGPYILCDDVALNFDKYDIGDNRVINFCAIQNIIVAGRRMNPQTIINWIKKYETDNNINNSQYWKYPSLDECYTTFLTANDEIIRTKYSTTDDD
jgi:hypothetical protein